MKKIGKKTIAAVLAGTTVAATGVLLGVGLTNWTDNSDDYIAIHYGDQELVLEEQEINELESFATELIEVKEVSSYEGEEENPEGEEPPEENPEENPEDTPDDGDDTNKEIAATWIETAFYYISLTGNLPSIETGEVTEITEDSIFGTAEYQNDFIIINNANDFNEVYTMLVEISLFRNTTGSGKYAYQYMNELAQEHPNLRPYTAPFMDPSYKTVWDMKEEVDAYTLLIDNLKYTMNMESDILTSLYVYAYLYQEHASSAFDYYMTEQLVDQKPMIMWEMSVSGLNATNQDEMNVLLDTDGYLNVTEMWGADVDQDGVDADLDNSEWQNAIDGDHNYNVGDIFKTDSYGLQGFLGFVSGTAATVNIEGFSDYDNFQVFYEGDITHIEKIADGQGANVGKINLAIDENDGSVIVADEDPKTGKVLAYVPLYPFSFAHNFQDDLYDSADFYSYSLTAYDVDNYNDPALNPSGNYTYEGTEEQKVTYFELVDLALENNNVLKSLFENSWITTDHSETKAFSLWLFDFVFRANMDNLTISAQQYWRSEGYYIELSGQYEEDYAQLLPLWIQK